MSTAFPFFGFPGGLDRSGATQSRGRRVPWLVRALPVAVALAFLGYVFIGTAPMIDPGASVSGDGSDIERVAVLALAALAGLSLAMRPRAALGLAARAWPIWLVLGWFCASVAWADFPDIALRRVAVTVLVTVIALAVAAGLIIPGLRGQSQCAVLPDEQPDPQFLLEPPDLMADRGLGNIQFARRIGEAQMPRRGLEGAQAVERGQPRAHCRNISLAVI